MGYTADHCAIDFTKTFDKANRFALYIVSNTVSPFCLTVDKINRINLIECVAYS